MRLIINARPESGSVLSVLDQQNVIASYTKFIPEIESTIDQIFQKWDIEAVQVIGPTAYTRRFAEYAKTNYPKVEVR